MALVDSAKTAMKRAIVRSGLLNLANGLLSEVVILRYHAVCDDPGEVAGVIGTSITQPTSVFRQQMEIVARRFHPLSIDDLLRGLRGELRLPKKSVVVTFDDGFADNLEIAAPILNRFGIPATFYIIVDCADGQTLPWFVRLRHALWTTQRHEWNDPLDADRTFPTRSTDDRRKAFIHACRQYVKQGAVAQRAYVTAVERALEVEPLRSNGLMLTWAQVRQLHGMGHTIGSHTLTHPNLAFVDPGTLAAEIGESKRRLERELNCPVDHFSYPNPALEPNFNAASHATVAGAGYKTAVTCVSGSVQATSDPLVLNRMWVPPDLDAFLWQLHLTALGRAP